MARLSPARPVFKPCATDESGKRAAKARCREALGIRAACRRPDRCGQRLELVDRRRDCRRACASKNTHVGCRVCGPRSVSIAAPRA